METVITPQFKINFPNLFKPRMNDLNGKAEYSLVALFPKGTDMSKLHAAIQKVCEKKWGTDATKWPKNIRHPFREQSDRAKYDDITKKEVLPPGYERGGLYMNLKSTNQPGVVNQRVEKILDPEEIYSGCECIASVRPFAYSQAGNNGVSFSLLNVQKVKDGEPLSGRTRAEDHFTPISQDPDFNASSIFS